MTSGVVQIDDCLLEGHLGITKELVAMQSVQKKFAIGAENGGCNMIKVFIVFFFRDCGWLSTVLASRPDELMRRHHLTAAVFCRLLIGLHGFLRPIVCAVFHGRAVVHYALEHDNLREDCVIVLMKVY
jgi:hypothetical protein